MGAKYLPTIKDIKASQRFQQNQKVRPKIQPPAPVPPAPVASKKP